MTNEVLRTDSDFPQHSEGQPVEWPTISHSITNNCGTNVQRHPIQRQRCSIGQTVSCRSRAKFHTVANDIPYDDEWFFRKGHEDFFEICISLPLQFSNILSRPLWPSNGTWLLLHGISPSFHGTSLDIPWDIARHRMGHRSTSHETLLLLRWIPLAFQRYMAITAWAIAVVPGDIARHPVGHRSTSRRTSLLLRRISLPIRKIFFDIRWGVWYNDILYRNSDFLRYDDDIPYNYSELTSDVE